MTKLNKIRWFRVATLIVIVVLINTLEIDSAQSHLVYLMQKNEEIESILNEKDTFTNNLKYGLVLHAETETDLIASIIIEERLQSIDEIIAGFIYFTTQESVCNVKNSSLNYKLFRLNFIKEKCRINHNEHVNTSLLRALIKVKLKYTSKKYFSCLHISTNATRNFSNRTFEFQHQGTQNIFTHIITTKELLPIYLVIILYSVLMLFSSLLSGLNVGLMSIDLSDLSLLRKTGTKQEKKYASKLYPLRKLGNLLLCSVLLANVLVNSTSTLIMGSYLDGLFAAIGSTFFIVVFGEIVPQAIFARFGLIVGYYTRHITYSLIYLTFVASYPLGQILDSILGKEMGRTYNRDKLKELMRQVKERKQIEEKEFKFISGALDFKNKTVKDIMVPLKDVFSLDINSILDYDTFKVILYHGYSRMPVYEHTKGNFVGIILIQDLLLNDPADKVPLRAVMDFFKHPIPKCKMGDKLEILFDKFRKGASHMAFVYNDDFDQEKGLQEAEGILTLEDIIEELVQSEIMDEADAKREKRRKRAKEFLEGKLNDTQISKDNLNIFVTQDNHSSHPIISPQVRKALFSFLSTNLKAFSSEFISPKILEALLSQPDMIKEKRNISESLDDSNTYLYHNGVEADYFIIILDGNAILRLRLDGLEINAGFFSYYGIHALLDEKCEDPNECVCIEQIGYVPDFTLRVSSYCVYMKITRKQWLDAVKKTLMERAYTTNQHGS